VTEITNNGDGTIDITIRIRRVKPKLLDNGTWQIAFVNQKQNFKVSPIKGVVGIPTLIVNLFFKTDPEKSKLQKAIDAIRKRKRVVFPCQQT
jgi:hypothetical protein